MIQTENNKPVQIIALLLSSLVIIALANAIMPMKMEPNKLTPQFLTASGFLFLAFALLNLSKHLPTLAARGLGLFLGLSLVVFSISSYDLSQNITASLFLIAAVAILIETTPYTHKHCISQLLALLIFSIILLTMIGQTSQGTESVINDLSLTDYLGFILFSTGLFLCFPQSAIAAYLFKQSTGAIMLRHLIPFIVLVPLSSIFLSHLLAKVFHFNHTDGHIVNAGLTIGLLIYCGWFLRKQIDTTESQFKLMTNAAPIMMWMTDAKGKTYYFNQQWLRFTGRQLDDEITITYQACVHPDDLEMAYSVYQQAFENKTACCLEYRLLHHSGHYRWILENASPYWDINKKFKGFIGSCTDISEQKMASEKMQLTSYVFEHSIQGIMITDAQQKIIMTNPAFSELTGYPIDEIINKTPAFLNSGNHEKDFYIQIDAELKSKGYWQGETWNRRKNGELFLEDLSINVVLDEKGLPLNYIGIFTDITERKITEEHYQHLAHYDPLTDLPNRTLLTDRIEQALVQAQRHRYKIAVLFIDLNRFKLINDSLGHHIGDLLLKEVAQRLKESIRNEDTVARLGGDEFVILCPSLNHRNDVLKVITKIVYALSKPYHLEEYTLENSPSIGVALSPEHGHDMKSLLKNADSAMYKTKHNTDTHYAFYEP